MRADLPVWVTWLVLTAFVLLALFPTRLHFALRFLALFGFAAALFILGVLAPDVYFGAFPPLDDMMGSLNGWIVGLMGFLVGVPVAVLAWGIRRLLTRRQEAEG
ncbi:MAG: hypothetical protein ACOX9B_07235 [Candidatus Xenobium sp.]|jgi:hypothetical protein|nr:hypothetical protein [Burkholderiales bacterium]